LAELARPNSHHKKVPDSSGTFLLEANHSVNRIDRPKYHIEKFIH
jgi:hypothetical protein